MAASATAGRESAVVSSDQTQNVNDYRVTVKLSLTTGTPGGSKAAYVLIKTSNDSGTTWDGNATGSDANITIDSPSQFFIARSIPIGAQSLTRIADFSLKAACGGSIPERWGIIIINDTGIALASSSNSVFYREEYNT
jgi:hypothetical protein